MLFQWKKHSAGFLSSIVMILMNIITYHYVNIRRVIHTVDIKQHGFWCVDGCGVLEV